MTDDGEALRRRLYRPGAAGEDVAAYRAIVEPKPEPEPEPEPSPPSRRSSRPPRPVLVAVPALLLAAVLLAVVVVPRIGVADRPAAAVPTPLPTRPVTAATSARFVAELDAGHDAGLGAWFDPQAPFLEQHGTGDGTVELPPSGSAAGGDLEVLLVLAADGTAGWETARLVVADGTRAILRQRDAGATGALRAGVPTLARVVYPVDHRPLRLLVHAPAGTRWGVAAVFTR